MPSRILVSVLFSTVALALVLAAVSSGSTPRAAAFTTAAGPFVSGEVLVQFKPGAAANARAAAHSQAGGSPGDEIARTSVQLVSVAPGREDAAIKAYLRNPNVLNATPNYLYSIIEPVAHSSGTEVMPGDFYFDEQWALHNTGQLFQCIIPGWCFYIGTPDADIDAPEAWAISQGAGVKIAIVDTGIDYTHPDLASRYAGGHDFLNHDSDPMDDMLHGTHVAGIAAAAMNNLTGNPAEEEGVAGVAPAAQLLAYKVCDSQGQCPDFAIEQGIAQAITDGAKVINISLVERRPGDRRGGRK
jgi:thermitase